MIDAIAYALGRDPLEVRKRNLYGGDGRNLTPYGQTVEDNVVARADRRAGADADYRGAGARRSPPATRTSPSLKRGLALTPVKFGISFTADHLNQAGALVHVYTDGSMHLNHGGTEMGQGLNIKVAQVVADEFQVDARRVKITADDAPTRCPTPRPPPPPPAATSTAWRPRRRRARSRSG